VAWVRELTIPTEWPPIAGEVSFNFCGKRVPRGECDGFLRPYSRLSRPEPLPFLPSSSSVVLTKLFRWFHYYYFPTHDAPPSCFRHHPWIVSHGLDNTVLNYYSGVSDYRAVRYLLGDDERRDKKLRPRSILGLRVLIVRRKYLFLPWDNHYSFPMSRTHQGGHMPTVKEEIHHYSSHYSLRLCVHPNDLIIPLLEPPDHRRLRRFLPNDLPTRF
jgi:hypothetical protein